MKKFFKALCNRPILFVLIFIIIVYLPTGISSAPEGLKRQHASTIGIDISEVGVEVSLLSYISTQSQSYQEKYILISGKGETISKAISEIESITGRQIALTHSTVIILSEEILQLGAEKYLDYFYRNENVANNSQLICIKGKAKDMLKLEQEIVNSTNVGMEELALYNADKVFFADTDLESFYKGFFSPIKCSVIGVAELMDNPDTEQQGQGGGGSSSSSGGSGGEQSSGTSKKRIKSFLQLGIIKDGKLGLVLNEEDILATNLINNASRETNFEVLGVNDNLYNNANIVFEIISNAVKTKTFFEGDKPVVEYTSLLGVRILEINGEKIKKDYFKNNINFMTPTLMKKIEATAKEKFATLVLKLIENKTDIIGVYSTFLDQNYGKFLSWYNNLDDKEDFLRQIEFRMSITPVLTK